jgi:magnesium-transporting ATPase (P-type)
MGEGAAMSLEVSDITLVDSNLTKLLYVIQMGSRVVRTVQENIALSLCCKLAVVALTFGGYMTLMYAIVSDLGVMLLVTLNGMKLIPNDSANLSHYSQSRRCQRKNTLKTRRSDSFDGSDSSENDERLELL